MRIKTKPDRMETVCVQYFDDLCRTCMSSYDSSNKPQHQWHLVFGTIEECGDLPLAQLMAKTVPQIEVYPSDELPKKICDECIQHLLSVHRFQQKCIESQQKLRALIAKRKADFIMQMNQNENEFLQQVMLSQAMGQGIECVNILTDSSQASDDDVILIPETAARREASATRPSPQKTIIVSKKQIIQLQQPDAPPTDIAGSLHINTQGDDSEFFENEQSVHKESNIEYEDIGELVANDSRDDENKTCAFNDRNAECCADETMHSSVTTDDDDVVFVETVANQTSLPATRVTCNLCNKSYKGQRSLKVHMKRHKKWEKPKEIAAPQSNEPKPQFNCDICHLYFYKLETLQFHSLEHKADKKLSRNTWFTRLQHPLNKTSKYICHICNEAFKYPSLLTYHNLRNHSKEQTNSLPECGQPSNT